MYLKSSILTVSFSIFINLNTRIKIMKNKQIVYIDILLIVPGYIDNLDLQNHFN